QAQPTVALQEQNQTKTVYEHTLADGTIVQAESFEDAIKMCDPMRELYERNRPAAEALFKMSAKPVIVPVTAETIRPEKTDKRKESEKVSSVPESTIDVRELQPESAAEMQRRNLTVESSDQITDDYMKVPHQLSERPVLLEKLLRANAAMESMAKAD